MILPVQLPAGSSDDLTRNLESFLGWHLAFLIVVPFLVLVLLAWSRARNRKQRLREFTDASFSEDVLASPLPVLVHFFRAWSVADQAVIAQTEQLAARNEGRIAVGWLDMDRNPETVAYLEPLESPAVILFLDGRKIYQRGGLFQAEDLQRDLDRVLGPGTWQGEGDDGNGASHAT